jgi:hypothetical protein
MDAAAPLALQPGHQLTDSDGRHWLVRDLLPIARLAGQSPCFLVRLDFRTSRGTGGSMVMPSQEFLSMVQRAISAVAH